MKNMRNGESNRNIGLNILYFSLYRNNGVSGIEWQVERNMSPEGNMEQT